MNEHLLPILFVLGLWWLSTGIILKLVWRPRSTFQVSVVVLAAVAMAGLFGLSWSSARATVGGAYVSFASAIAVWAFHELTFLLGYVTGARKEPCPDDARGWKRFKLGAAVVMHHEIALAATLLATVILAWSGPNRVGAWTFFILWIMRLSAKLNVFLGVRNLTEQFVPAHLRYMLSYFRKARLNALMPFSILVGGATAVWLASGALAANATAFTAVSRTLLGAILSLAVVEHFFLAVPMPDAVLWRWAIRNKITAAEAGKSANHAVNSGVSAEVPR